MLKPVFALAAIACLGLAACGPTAEEAPEAPVVVVEPAPLGDTDDGAMENAGEAIDGVGNDIEDAVDDATDGNPNTNP